MIQNNHANALNNFIMSIDRKYFFHVFLVPKNSTYKDVLDNGLVPKQPNLL